MGASSRNPSLWLLTPAADRLFKAAKERIYTIENGNEPTKDNPKPVKRLIPVLEENPKWRLLHQVLSEIEGRYKKLNTHKGDRVLVMVKDERTLDSIRSYLVDGKEKTMKKRWLGYLKHVNDRARALAKSSGGASYVPEQTRLLLEEEGKIRNYLFGPGQKNTHVKPQGTGDNSSNKSKRKAASLNAMPSWKKKRRKIQEERCRGNAMMDSIEDREQVAMLDEALQETEHYDVEIISKTTNLYNGYDNPYKTNNSSNNTALHHDDDDNNDDNDDNDDDDDEFMLYRAEEINDLRVVIQTYSSAEGEQAYLLLNDIKPNYIVLYDAEPSFIRSIEIHSAAVCQDDDKGNNNKNGETTTEDRLRVYFMLFEASSEEKNYLRALEREQNAFERLIQHKKTMALPVNMLGPWTTQEMQLAGGNGVGGSYNSGSLPLSMDTRTGRGKKVNAEKRDVAVDVREFRSALPCILHQGGMRLAPVTLTVGDFVLSNVHCIERKSISDLFGSFASGRLFSQAETMSKHYKVPCLLIEFNPSKTFCLQNANEIGPDLRSDSVCSKMSLLMMHFPKLRLLWSRSPYETLKLFKRLKSNHEEVDVAKAVAIGSNESIDALLMGGAGNNNDNNANTDDGSAKDDVQQVAVDINEAGKDMLLRLPGITMHNARKVMSACDTIAELASFPREEMKRLLGPLAGQKLFTFFNQNMEFK
jgi:DNA excision repair protein ERCC-4